MITHESGPDRAARWLVRYLAEQPGCAAESSQIKEAAEAQLNVTSRYTLDRARKRSGIKVHTGSLPGRPFVTWWVLPKVRKLTLTDSERDHAERVVREMDRGNLEKAQELLESRPIRSGLALAILVSESRSGS